MELTGLALLASLLLAFGTDVNNAASWGYEGKNGPLYWHELFPQACSGKYQSPIDIRPEQTMHNPDLKDFAIWHDPPRPGSTMTLLNNGHSVQVVTNGDFFVANGGLPYVYKTAQFHFHWGHAKHHGSEHLIDSKAYPLEMHIVNYNSDLYADIGQAVTEKQGLAVLGVMFEITDEDNKELEPIIAAMDKVRDPEEGMSVQLEPMSLRNLLPQGCDLKEYYRYNGSLTTPGCFESVVWTVFAKPRGISHRQIRKFREMLQMRHRPGGGHHKRSADYNTMPVSSKLRRRERRALQVLDELALTPEQQLRFRRDLANKKEHADKTLAKMDLENAGKTHHHTLDAVHDEPAHNGHDDKDDHNDEISEVEIEYIQEKMVNNFRPVQPLNDRIVYRSFKLTEEHKKHHHHHSHHSDSHDQGSNLPDEATLKRRLEVYRSTDAAASSAISLALLLTCGLLAFFL